ncbi:MAG TPA: citrate transporter [Candidatus Dormibacteraeota bacterium]|nr:citrate transporter [Candidatus Dormibacteraeota bacterium]
MIAGAALVAIFALAAVLMWRRALPALLAVPLVAVAAGLASGVPVHALLQALGEGASGKIAPAYVAVIFGALLGRVTMRTGIAEYLVSRAAEFGGDRPYAVVVSVGLAVAALFTTLTGLGAIVMVGGIALPVMLSVGVRRETAAAAFLMFFALGATFNVALWTLYGGIVGAPTQAFASLAPMVFVPAAAAVAAFLFVSARRERGFARLALDDPFASAAPAVPWPALIAPVLPLILILVFRWGAWGPVPAFLIAAVYAALVVRPRDAVQTLVSGAVRGIEDVAPAVFLMIGIGMLLQVAALPQVHAALAPVVARIAPHHALAYVALFGVLSPLALYRGPLNPVGVGVAIFAVLAQQGALPPVALAAAVLAVVQVQNVCDPTNTQNVWVANQVGVEVETITKLTLPFQTAAAIAVAVAAAAWLRL